jgi:hypothetical protein
MNLVKLVIWARKIHRYLVIIISVISPIMMVTGFKLHKEREGEIVLSFIDATAARTLHNQLSTIFAIVLGLMMLTGIYLYIFPWLTKIFKKPSPTP